MRQATIEHLRELFEGHQHLAESLPPEVFTSTLDGPSNTVGEQFWCVVGARESYGRAIENDKWAGFSCSLSAADTRDKERVVEALQASHGSFTDTIEGIEWTGRRENLLLALLEHEAQHQGQLIRYGYGLPFDFPKSWVDRWALD